MTVYTEYLYNNYISILCIHILFILLTKGEVKMARYWPSSLFAFLWTETKSRSLKTQKENEITESTESTEHSRADSIASSCPLG